MKKTFVYGLAVSMIATSMAVAATPKKVAATKPAKAATTKATKSKKVEAAKTQETTKAAPIAAPAPVAAAPAPVAAPAAQTTASAPAVTKAAAPKRWGVMIEEHLNTADSVTLNNSDKKATDAAGVLTLRPSYKLNDTTSAAVGIDIKHSYGNKENGKAAWTPLDPYMMLSKSAILRSSVIDIDGSTRFYVPTSEASQDKGQIGQLRGDLTFGHAFGPFKVSYYANPRYYFQQYKTYKVLNGETKKMEDTGTMAYRYRHSINGELTLTEKLSLNTELGIDHMWFNGDSNAGVGEVQKDMAVANVGAAYAFSGSFILSAGLEANEDADLRDPAVNSKQGLPYREEFNTYYVDAIVNF